MNLPYISHPTMVAMYLMKLGLDEEIVAAAILHDTVEDTNIELEDIEKEFGERVMKLVAGCTEDKSKTWKERKQHQLDAIRIAPFGVLMIKLADKLHNISSTAQDLQIMSADELFKGFNSGFDSQKWYYQGLVDSFSTREEVNTTDMFKEFKQIVSDIFD